jgi:type I restriction enzyme, R subunit
VYYEKMSVLLLELVRLRKEGAMGYEELLKRYEALAKDIEPNTKKTYPEKMNTKGKQALYDNLEQNEALVELIDGKMEGRDNDWTKNGVKQKRIKGFIREAFKVFNIADESDVQRIYDLLFQLKEYN